jgi:hypothetical protein
MDKDIRKKYVLSTPCNICQASWYNKKIGPHTKKCDRCAFEARKKDFILTYSIENRMIPAPLPEELADLTYIEERVIAMGSPALHIWCRKGGMTGFKGNCIGMYQ